MRKRSLSSSAARYTPSGVPQMRSTPPADQCRREAWETTAAMTYAKWKPPKGDHCSRNLRTSMDCGALAPYETIPELTVTPPSAQRHCCRDLRRRNTGGLVDSVLSIETTIFESLAVNMTAPAFLTRSRTLPARPDIIEQARRHPRANRQINGRSGSYLVAKPPFHHFPSCRLE